MLSDAPLYSAVRSMQVRDTEALLTTLLPRMDWSGQDQDVVMDVGCGSGDSVRNLLLPAFPRVRKVVAVDVLPDMIQFARGKNAHEKIEYHVADIEQRHTIERWSGQISKVVSIFCFNWLGDHEKALRNVWVVLKEGGQAAIYFALSARLWDSYQTHIDNPKWNPYLKNANPCVPECHYKKQGASHYRNMLKDIGFDIIVCEEEEKTFSYPSDDNCRAACFSRCGLSSYIPDHLKEEFKDELFQGFLKHSGRDSEGKPQLHYKTLTILIEKPRL